MSDPLQPYGLSPTGLLCPLSTRLHQDSPGKNTGKGLSCPTPVDLPNPGLEPASLMSPALAGKFFTICATWEDQTGLPPKCKVCLILKN